MSGERKPFDPLKPPREFGDRSPGALGSLRGLQGVDAPYLTTITPEGRSEKRNGFDEVRTEPKGEEYGRRDIHGRAYESDVDALNYSRKVLRDRLKEEPDFPWPTVDWTRDSTTVRWYSQTNRFHYPIGSGVNRAFTDPADVPTALPFGKAYWFTDSGNASLIIPGGVIPIRQQTVLVGTTSYDAGCYVMGACLVSIGGVKYLKILGQAALATSFTSTTSLIYKVIRISDLEVVVNQTVASDEYRFSTNGHWFFDRTGSRAVYSRAVFLTNGFGYVASEYSSLAQITCQDLNEAVLNYSSLSAYPGWEASGTGYSHVVCADWDRRNNLSICWMRVDNYATTPTSTPNSPPGPRRRHTVKVNDTVLMTSTAIGVLESSIDDQATFTTVLDEPSNFRQLLDATRVTAEKNTESATELPLWPDSGDLRYGAVLVSYIPQYSYAYINTLASAGRTYLINSVLVYVISESTNTSVTRSLNPTTVNMRLFINARSFELGVVSPSAEPLFMELAGGSTSALSSGSVIYNTLTGDPDDPVIPVDPPASTSSSSSSVSGCGDRVDNFIFATSPVFRQRFLTAYLFAECVYNIDKRFFAISVAQMVNRDRRNPATQEFFIAPNSLFGVLSRTVTVSPGAQLLATVATQSNLQLHMVFG